ncbi:hypothetical protein E2C01_078092 [Portunus trituberculatus]|uniref:Uncharacterized protein n=1 Tax=Portunus trituberculatus TaxID=210409 RepID=A0A5B7ILR1_PORTR|nr:hypothetical protein [Portunus trituberculatus]
MFVQSPRPAGLRKKIPMATSFTNHPPPLSPLPLAALFLRPPHSPNSPPCRPLPPLTLVSSYCRRGLLARRTDHAMSLFIPYATTHHLPPTTTDAAVAHETLPRLSQLSCSLSAFPRQVIIRAGLADC